jgi:hypothetical protein
VPSLQRRGSIEDSERTTVPGGTVGLSSDAGARDNLNRAGSSFAPDFVGFDWAGPGGRPHGWSASGNSSRFLFLSFSFLFDTNEKSNAE